MNLKEKKKSFELSPKRNLILSKEQKQRAHRRGEKRSTSKNYSFNYQKRLCIPQLTHH